MYFFSWHDIKIMIYSHLLTREYLGVWCNGNMPVSKTVLEGSSPSTPAKSKKQSFRVGSCFFIFRKDSKRVVVNFVPVAQKSHEPACPQARSPSTPAKNSSSSSDGVLFFNKAVKKQFHHVVKLLLWFSWKKGHLCRLLIFSQGHIFPYLLPFWLVLQVLNNL